MARLRSALSAALAVALTLGVAGLVGGTAAPAQADDTTTFLAVAAPGQTLDEPAVLTTAAGQTTLAVWLQQSTVGGTVVRTPQLRRQVAGGAWTPVAVDLGGLDVVGTPHLVQDPATGRVLLTASAFRNGALDSTLGTYLWWSGDDGVSFSAPIRVWSSFGDGDAAPDGAGGFWTTTGQAGAYVAHVTAAYTAEAPIQLTDRVGSRGAMALTTGGASRTPVLAFQAGSTGLWAHHGTSNDAGADTSLFPTGDGLHVAAAGNPTGVMVAAVRPAGTTSKALFSRTLDPATGAAGIEQRVSPGDAVFFEVRPLSVGAVAVWNDAAGDVWVRSTVGGILATWADPFEVLSGSASGVSYISDPDVSVGAAVGLGNRAGDSAQVVWATRTAPVTAKPTIKAAKGSSYAAGKRTISLRLVAGAPGKVKATVVVAGATKKPLRQRATFTVTSAGKVKQRLRLSKKLAAQLAAHPRARITVKLTLTNAAGKDSVKVRVRRR